MQLPFVSKSEIFLLHQLTQLHSPRAPCTQYIFGPKQNWNASHLNLRGSFQNGSPYPQHPYLFTSPVLQGVLFSPKLQRICLCTSEENNFQGILISFFQYVEQWTSWDWLETGTNINYPLNVSVTAVLQLVTF